MFRVLEELNQPTLDKKDATKSYDCDLCDSGDWLSETEVDIHKRSMHKKELQKLLTQENTCLTCGEQLDSKDSLLRHVKSVHLFSSGTARRVEREVFVCDHCNELFFNKALLAAHIVHKHRNKIVLTCPKCPRKLKPRLAYRHLSGKHQLQSVSLCPICLTKRPDRAELARHVATHKKYYHCTICGYMSTKERDFNLHLDTYARRARGAGAHARCFVPPAHAPRRTLLRGRPVLAGAAVPQPLFLCVLCRALCAEGDMLDHVAREHSSAAEAARAALSCACGEQFVNRIMLKYHVFKLGGDHREIKQGIIVKPGPQATSQAPEATDAEDKTDEIVEEAETTDSQPPSQESADEDLDERYLVIVTDSNDSPAMRLQVTVDSDEEIEAGTSLPESTEVMNTTDE